MEYNFDFVDSLALVDGFYSNHIVIAVEDVLVFTSSANTKAIYQTVADALTFRQYNSGAKPIRLSISDVISFNQSFSPTHFFQVYDSLSFTQSQVSGRPILSLSDLLEFTQTAWVVRPIHSLTVSQTLTFKTHFDVLFPLHCDGGQYSNIIITGIGSINLRAPTYGNRSTVNQTRVQRNIRGGDIILFAADSWPKDELIEYDFDAMAQDIRLLQTFVNRNLGKLVTIVDFDGVTQEGIIVADPEIRQTGRGCQFQATLQLQRLFS